MAVALLVESDLPDRRALRKLFVAAGWEVCEAASLAEAREVLARTSPEMVVCDLKLEDGSGLELLDELGHRPAVGVVLTADAPTLQSALSAVRLGAFDFLVKPISEAEVRRVLNDFGQEEGAVACDGTGLPADGSPERLVDLVTVSPAMSRVFQRVRRVASTDVTVFVQGESGTGKELVARAVHRLSARRDGPFLALNCGAVSPTIIESELFGHERGSFTGAERRHLGVFERAHQGTLLLDEITEMPAELQVKLLRVLETGKVTRVGGREAVKASPRIVAATNRRADEEVAAGRLREDLFYRLKVFPIELPTLRERGPEEVAFLAEHFVDELNRREGGEKLLAAGARKRLQEYHWPGNVRELINVLETAFVMADEEIRADHVVFSGGVAVAAQEIPGLRIDVGTTIAAVEEELIVATLEHFDGDKPETAETLGISLKTLYNRLKSYHKRDHG